MSTILDQIVASKRREIEAARTRTPEKELEARATAATVHICIVRATGQSIALPPQLRSLLEQHVKEA